MKSGRAEANSTRAEPDHQRNILYAEPNKDKRVSRRHAFLAAAVFMVTFLPCASLVSAAQGIIVKNADSSGQYCHLKFPAITRESLFTDRPELKDPGEGDIIDFYGPCDHDPLGKAEIDRQKADRRRQFTRRD